MTESQKNLKGTLIFAIVFLCCYLLGSYLFNSKEEFNLLKKLIDGLFPMAGATIIYFVNTLTKSKSKDINNERSN